MPIPAAFDLSGRVAVITGAGSPDRIGFATARLLADLGAAVMISVTTARVHDRVSELRGAGFDAVGFTGDLTDAITAAGLVSAALDQWGRLDGGRMACHRRGPSPGSFVMSGLPRRNHGDRTRTSRLCRRYPGHDTVRQGGAAPGARAAVVPVCDPWLAVPAHGGYDANVSSTNPTVRIDSSSPVPLHEQVAAAIRRAIADGEAGPGERLPPARDLAAVLGVNANTVFRALRTLREEGLVEFRRGRGVSVTASAAQRSPVVTKARELVAVARRYGYQPEELVTIIEQVS